MTNIIRTCALTVGLCIAAGSISAEALTIDDYCNMERVRPESVRIPVPLSDGETYAAISENGRAIEVYSYRTGKKVSTLFSLDAQKGDVRIEDFDGYSISENGRKILLWNNVTKIYRHSFTAEYYVLDTMRGTLQRVSDKGAQRGATLSHDGRMVAYMRDNNVWISNLDYVTDKAITTDGKINEVINGIPDWAYEEEFGMITAMRWSRDDNTLAFIRFDESKVPVYSFDHYKSYCDNDPLSDPYPQAYKYKYPLAGYPNSVVGVYAYNVDNRTIKKMGLEMADDSYVPLIEFDSEGRNLMVMVLNRDQNDLKVYKVNPGSTVPHLVYSETSTAWLSPSAYQMCEFGASSFIIGSEKSGYRHLYEYDYNGNLLRQLSKGDWNVTAYYGRDQRSGHIYVQTTQNGAINRNVASIDKAGRAVMLNKEAGTENAWFSKGCRYYLRNHSTATEPPVYTICDNKGKKLVEVESNEEYARRYAAAPKKEFLKVPNAVGEMMDAFVIKPADFNASKRYPLLMYQYNGPDSQEVLNRWKMEGLYYIASQGYIVACVDGRGTGNRNREWSTCVYRKLGQYETADQLAGASWFASQNYVDAENTACFGWSYGGYMSLMEITDKACKFKAAVAMAPVTDWRWYDSIYTERYMSTPQQNSAGYNMASTMSRTGDLKGRLLIMSGTSDDNVHFYNTLKFTSKLFNEGTVFDMMALTGFEHSLPMCNARTYLYKKIADFLNKNLK